MPNCFTLTRKGASEPSTFVAIDEEICAYCNIPVDPDLFAHNWYDTIGLNLACGRSLDELLESATARYDPEDPEDLTMLRILRYLNSHYTSDSWYERGGRR